MRVISEVRRLRLGMLRDEQSLSWADMSRKIGRSSRDSTLSQVWHRSPDSKTGRPRQMGDEQARALEAAFGKPLGWMDRDPELDELEARLVDVRAHEPSSTYIPWPLDGVAPEDFFRLPDAARAQISALAKGAVMMLDGGSPGKPRSMQAPRPDFMSSSPEDKAQEVVGSARKQA